MSVIKIGGNILKRSITKTELANFIIDILNTLKYNELWRYRNEKLISSICEKLGLTNVIDSEFFVLDEDRTVGNYMIESDFE